MLIIAAACQVLAPAATQFGDFEFGGMGDDARPLGKSLPAPSPITAGGEVAVERYLIPGRHPADVRAVVAGLLDEKVTPVPVRVTDPQGAPVSGATVRAHRASRCFPRDGRTRRGV